MEINYNNTECCQEDASRGYTLNDHILSASYERSHSSGIQKDTNTLNNQLSGNDLIQFIDTNTSIAIFIRGLFIESHHYLTNRNNLFILTDRSGRIIECYSDSKLMNTASQSGLRVGASLAEESAGTNSVSLSLQQQEPVVLYGNQHYCSIFNDWFSVAMPVMYIDGKPLGSIAIFSFQENKINEKLALINLMASQLINYHSSLYRESNSRPPLTVEEPKPPIQLTNRQHQVLKLFSKGKSYKEIARQLGITSPKTVEEHLDAIRNKFAVKTRRECIEKAMAFNLI